MYVENHAALGKAVEEHHLADELSISVEKLRGGTVPVMATALFRIGGRERPFSTKSAQQDQNFNNSLNHFVPL